MKKIINGKNIVEKIAKQVRANDNFLIIAHDNLDGDSIGSALALGLALKNMGKKSHFLSMTPVPARYSFLPGIKKLIIKKANLKNYDVLCVLDTAGWSQIKKLNANSFKNHLIINIDHHIDNKKFGTLNWVDTNASAVGEQIFCLLNYLKVPITPQIAACLYTSILTDTGSFRFSNTTTNTHKIVSSLIQKGISISDISNQIYEKMPLARLNLLQNALKTIKTKRKGQVSWMWITIQMLNKTKTNKEYAEGFIDYLKTINGVKIAVLFKEERNKNEFRVTFRSKDPSIHVNKLAHIFGGGGHPAAAGCSIIGKKNEVEKKVLKEAVKFL